MAGRPRLGQLDALHHARVVLEQLRPTPRIGSTRASTSLSPGATACSPFIAGNIATASTHLLDLGAAHVAPARSKVVASRYADACLVIRTLA